MSRLSFFFYYIVRLITGGLLIWQGIDNLFPIEPFEFRLVEQHLSGWLMVPFMSRMIISLKFITGLMFILNINPKNIFSRLFVLIVVLNVFDLIWELANQGKIILSCYGCFFNQHSFLSILLNGLLIGAVFLLNRKQTKTDWNIRWMKYVFLLAIVPIPFIFNPVFPDDFIENTQVFSEPFQSFPATDSLKPEKVIRDLSSGKKLVVFFSIGCPYCQMAAKKLSVAAHIADIPPVLIFFLGEEEGIQYFFSETNTRFPYQQMNDTKTFFTLSGPSLPSFFYLENGIIKRKWDGRTFNYKVVKKL